MAICKKELMCDIEIEFAFDPVPGSHGAEADLKLLQVRPVAGNDETSISNIYEVMKTLSTEIVDCDNVIVEAMKIDYPGAEDVDPGFPVRLIRSTNVKFDDVTCRGKHVAPGAAKEG